MYLTDPKIQALREAGKGTICANLPVCKLTMTFEGEETKIQIVLNDAYRVDRMFFPKYPNGDTDYSQWLESIEAITKSSWWEII